MEIENQITCEALEQITENFDELDEKEQIRQLPEDQIFSYSLAKIHSQHRFDLKEGLDFILDLSQKYPSNEDYLYFTAFSYFRLSENEKSRQAIHKILSNDPNNQRAKSLLTLVEDSVSGTAKLGMFILSCATISAGVFIYKLNRS